MRKWLVPLLMLGAGGAGAFLLSERGRLALRRLLAKLESAPAVLDDWNESAQAELERIQIALEQISQSLEPRGEPGR
jgi:hypothetical protein